MKIVVTAVLAAGVVAVPVAALAGGSEQQRPAAALPPPGAHVAEQAHALSGQVHRPRRKAPVPVAPFTDGCDRGYGRPDQCVPVRAPGNQPVTCAYLRAAGWLTTPLVYRHDHLGLAVNGVVCG